LITLAVSWRAPIARTRPASDGTVMGGDCTSSLPARRGAQRLR